MTGVTIETATPTYHWATAAGAASSISGLVALAVCIAVSATNPTPAGFAPIPYGISTLACVMTLGGLILLLFRILHADRDEMMRQLEAVDQKLDNVWGIAAVSSIETKPFHPQSEKTAQQKHTQRRGRRKHRREVDAAAGENVIPLRARRAADALRRLTEQIKDEPNG